MIRSVYVAAPFICKDEAKAAKQALEALGIEVTSRWIDSHLSDWTATDQTLTKEAMEDMLDIHRAEGLVLLNLPGSSGGMFAELGIALAKGKPVWMVGERPRPSCIFLFHPNVQVIKDVQEVVVQYASVVD